MIQRRQFIGSLAAVCTLSGSTAKLFAANFDRTLQWPCQVIQTIPHDYGTKAPVVTGVSLRPDGKQVAIVGDDHYVCVYDSIAKRFVAQLGEHTDWVRTTKFSPNGQWLASAGNDRQLKVWETGQFKKRARVFDHDHAIINISYTSDSKKLATVGFDRELRIYNLEHGRIERRLNCECPDNHAVAISNDDSMVAAGGRSGVVRVWDINTGARISQFQPHKRRIRAIEFTATNQVISCGDDQIVQITDPRNTAQAKTLPRHSAKLFSISMLDDDLLATAGSDNMIHIWRISDGAEIGTLKGHTGTVSCLDVAANHIASGSFDTQVRIWDMQNGPVERHTKSIENQNLQFN